MDHSRQHVAALFRSLHATANPLRLANVWDVATAKIAEHEGAAAVATTSAGVSWSAGRPDGEQLSRRSAFEYLSRIVDAVRVPVTVDIEGGYANSRENMMGTAMGVLEVGAAGINIEDGSRPPAQLAARITIIREAAASFGTDLFVNARTDVFLEGIGTLDEQVAVALHRARMYVDAGADGIFVPGAVDEEVIAALTSGISVPVNVMVGPGSLTVDQLSGLGVARVSLGSGIAQMAYTSMQRAIRELHEQGTYNTLAGGIGYDTLNSLMAPAGRKTE